MEDQLWKALYPVFYDEYKRRGRQRRKQFNDAIILLVALWAVLHDRPVRWACRKNNWHGVDIGDLPSPATMSRRLRTLSVQLLLERVFYRFLSAVAADAFCLCRRIDSKPLPVGGFSKDRDARWGYATGGKCKGYKLFCCWGKAPTVPETLMLAPLNFSDQSGAIGLIDRLKWLHRGAASGYVLADSTHDTNPLHAHAGAHGLQPITPRKQPGTELGHRQHSPSRLRSIALLEPPSIPMHNPEARLGPELYRMRTQIERDYGNLSSFGGGLQPLPSWVRRPHRVALWIILKLIINAARICRNTRLAA
jgi:hypothetical protein